jgi:hypothetical protein
MVVRLNAPVEGLEQRREIGLGCFGPAQDPPHVGKATDGSQFRLWVADPVEASEAAGSLPRLMASMAVVTSMMLRTAYAFAATRV